MDPDRVVEPADEAEQRGDQATGAAGGRAPGRAAVEADRTAVAEQDDGPAVEGEGGRGPWRVPTRLAGYSPSGGVL